MNFIGCEVEHEKYGHGQVVSVKGNYIQVSFESVGTKIFQYPGAFENFLSLVNPSDKSLANDMIREFKAEEERKLKRQEEMRLRLEGDIREEIREKYEKQKQSEETKTKSIRQTKSVPNNLIVDCEIVENLDEVTVINPVTQRDLEIASSVAEFESDVFAKKIAYAGFFQSGSRAGQGVRMARLKENSLIVLTCCKDGNEEDREVVALFLADQFFKGSEKESAWVKCNSEYFLKFSEEEAKRMRIWPFFEHLGSEAPLKLVSTKYRYFSDREAAYILREGMELKVGTPDQERAEKFFEHFCSIHNIDKSLRFDD